MEKTQYEKVCYATEQREESVPLKNRKTGEIGFTYSCTFSGTTVQVRLQNGELDSWDQADCIPMSADEVATPQSREEIKPCEKP